MKKRVLIIEDEENIQKLIKLNLEIEGYEVEAVSDGLAGMLKLKQAHYDIILLDLMLPKVDGIKILQSIKIKYPEIPVIIASARDTSADRILGLKTGADDYLNKPFEIEELVIRIEKLLNRIQTGSTDSINQYSWGQNIIDFNSMQGQGPKGKVVLTPKETLLLRLLIEKKNEVVSRNDILKNVWGYDVYPSTRTIDNFIVNLRKYFEVNPRQPEYFHSVRGVGYKFVLDA